MTKNRTPTPVYLDPGMHTGLEVKGLRVKQISLLPAYFKCYLLISKLQYCKKMFIVMGQEIAIYVKLGFHMNLLKTVYNIV